MFSNLQNKIDLRKLRNETVEVDGEFIFKEDFDIVNQTLTYFQEKKHKVNNVVIKEEVIEYENEATFSFLEDSVKAEQEFIYNDNDNLEIIKEADEDKKEMLKEGFEKYHKEQKLLPRILKEANDEARAYFDAYRMMGGENKESVDFQKDNNEYSVDALFDSSVLEMAKKEHLESIYTINWLEKQLVDYRKTMSDDLSKGRNFQIDNGLKTLDVNDTEEIKNKIKDLQESIIFLNEVTILGKQIGKVSQRDLDIAKENRKKRRKAFDSAFDAGFYAGDVKPVNKALGKFTKSVMNDISLVEKQKLQQEKERLLRKKQEPKQQRDSLKLLDEENSKVGA